MVRRHCIEDLIIYIYIQVCRHKISGKMQKKQVALAASKGERLFPQDTFFVLFEMFFLMYCQFK